MIYLKDIIYYVKKNKVSLELIPEYKYIYDYNFHISEDNEIVIYIYLRQNKYGGEINWSRILYVKSSEIISYLRKDKLKNIKL